MADRASFHAGHDTIYGVPVRWPMRSLDNEIVGAASTNGERDMSAWLELLDRIRNPEGEVHIVAEIRAASRTPIRASRSAHAWALGHNATVVEGWKRQKSDSPARRLRGATRRWNPGCGRVRKRESRECPTRLSMAAKRPQNSILRHLPRHWQCRDD